MSTTTSPKKFKKDRNQPDKETLITKEGLRKLKEELEYLQMTRRREVAERIKEAISYGDLSENSEYEDAKNEQAFVEGRILELEEKIKNARIIDDSHHKTALIQLGTKVTIRSLDKKSPADEAYVIVGSTEADPLDNKISNESPLGKALLGKRAGENIQVIVPAGIVKYLIVKFV